MHSVLDFAIPCTLELVSEREKKNRPQCANFGQVSFGKSSQIYSALQAGHVSLSINYLTYLGFHVPGSKIFAKATRQNFPSLKESFKFYSTMSPTIIFKDDELEKNLDH